MAMMTRRLESMSTNGYLQLIKQDDGDIVLTIAEADVPTKRGVIRWSRKRRYSNS